jgi:Zn ribbon nucleic-acid-binding protein
MAFNLADAAIVRSPRFIPAFKELTAMCSLSYAVLLLDALLAYLKALRIDDPRSPFDAMTPGVAAPFAITLLHCEMGTPLFMTDALLNLWSKGDGTVAECVRCGYRMPLGVAVCVVCGGRNGEPGCWSQRKARVAGLN